MTVHWVDRGRLGSQLLFGTFLNLGCPLTAEIAASRGFDWVVIDMEHGAGDLGNLVGQLQAIRGFPCSPVVRVAENASHLVKRALDAGASGIMVPCVNSAAEAEQVVAAAKYPPDGLRGVAGGMRATGFGLHPSVYHAEANRQTLVVVQVETRQAVQSAPAIAGVPGVDVLFVGPLDLSYNMGCPKNFDDQEFRAAIKEVVSACRTAGKAAGIFFPPHLLQRAKDDGFTFIGSGSDGGCLNMGFDTIRQQMSQLD